MGRKQSLSLWKRVRHGIETFYCRLFAWFIPLLPRKSCVHFANGIGRIAFMLDWRNRKISLANLECVFGDSLTPAQRHYIARESYANSIRTLVDLFWSPALMRPANRHWLRAEGVEQLRERLAQEARGAVVLTLHFGNWEWASHALALAGLPAVTVTDELRNPGIGAIVKKLRESAGQTIIPQEKSMLRMLREVKRGGTAAFLADLTVPPTQASAVIRALGLEMCVSVLHGVLAMRADALVVPLICMPHADGSSVLKVLEPLDIPPDATPASVAQLCWDFYEPLVRARPDLWLWIYKHFRYRPAVTQVEYPFYAYEWDLFDRLRANPPGRAGGV